jgi:alpha-L-fucosidase
MYGLVCFNLVTFEDKEWGYGDADPAIFDPTEFSAEQIVNTAREGGLNGIILVCKHHEGFCLWPTKTTEYNISKSPWKDGQGDMVKEFQLACEKYGMKFGVYLSPWDRNSALYGKDGYIPVYYEQLRELLTGYGELFEVWFDGANGGDGWYGGADTIRNIDRFSYYGWDSIYQIVRELQPNAVIFSDMGDVRWVGNEEGYAGETSWCMYTPKGRDEDSKPAPGYTKYWEATEGHEDGAFWKPSECDFSIRPGWYYHEDQNDAVKSSKELFEHYLKTVGRNAAFNLGLPPDTRGIMHEKDVASLRGLKGILDEAFKTNLALNQHTETDVSVPGHRGKQLVDGNSRTCWAAPEDQRKAWISIQLDQPRELNAIVLQEDISLGQRVKDFQVEARIADKLVLVAEATTIGYKRILTFDPVRTDELKVTLMDSRAAPVLSEIQLYRFPDL